TQEATLASRLRTLHAAAAAVGAPYEVIVADDASADGTAAIAASHGARLVRVAYRQIAATRNAGARKAKGDFFLLVDADTLVSEKVVRGAIQALRHGAVGGGAAFQFDG